MRKSGCVLLRGVFSTGAIDALYREYQSQYGAMDSRQMAEQSAKPLPNPFLEVGGGRYEITPRMSGPFGAPELFANVLLRRFLIPPLGSDMRLSGFTIVVSYPGAPLQHIHRDHAHLFAEPGVGSRLPVYAVNVSVPLIDVDLETGPTGIWPGTHMWPEGEVPTPETATMIPFQRGDCILMDYRTLHTGLPNRSTRARPIIYMVYTRTWFFDEVNHAGRAPLDRNIFRCPRPCGRCFCGRSRRRCENGNRVGADLASARRVYAGISFTVRALPPLSQRRLLARNPRSCRDRPRISPASGPICRRHG
jgi:hypothetical protein